MKATYRTGAIGSNHYPPPAAAVASRLVREPAITPRADGVCHGQAKEDRQAQGLSRKEALLAWGRIADVLDVSDPFPDHQDAARPEPKSPQQDIAPRRQGPEIPR